VIHILRFAFERVRLRWVAACTDDAFYVAGADNNASVRLHAATGFLEVTRRPFNSDE